MAEEHNNVSEKTGKDLQDYLNELVTKKWQKGRKHQFCITKDQTKQRAFSIEANPTPDQPGNGRVTFGPNNSTAPPWCELLSAVLDTGFPKKRKTFLRNPLKDANFNEESTQANVLLLFEVARRRSDDTFYASTSEGEIIQPIYTRKNADDAIEAVMGIPNDKEAYKNCVSLIRDDNAFKNLFIPFCIYDGLKFYWIANCRFQCIELLLSRLLLCRDQIMAC